MSDFRYSALQAIGSGLATPDIKTTDQGNRKISEIFARNVFNIIKMKEYLPEDAFYKMVDVIKHNNKIDLQTAENVAEGLKKWAIENGATHFTHWFQPLTGSTAEKHDAFFKPSFDMMVQGVESLSASELIQREPDASSFPSGGLRGTSAARGYTIWDPSSPAFILETENGRTLYVPSVFISYTGEALDNKTPLLKANELMNAAATAVCNYFDPKVQNVITTLGWEQEYFLVDEHLYNARPDLVLTGRTLFGCPPAKGQQLEDHYFASIPERIQNYITAFETECLKLGIPVLTRHNEVAPGQYECAPMFEDLNVAVDHNLLLMDVMNRVAHKHGLRALFHEKPFAGINGNGKHNNWSMATDKGKNLLSPGDDPANNLYFLTFFINVIKAIEVHADLLRASIASVGNDYRLGANEAPPAIMSVFTGTFIEEILAGFKTKGLENTRVRKEILDLKISKIPQIALDNTDRNRTSPFPFTGNKFEFRAVGSSASCAPAMTVLNIIVANQLIDFKNEVDGLIETGKKKETAIVQVLQRYLTESEHVIFNGDGYSKDWEKEAMRRGLANLKTTPDALEAYLSEKSKKIFEIHDIFSEHELEARYEVMLENYVKKMDIECLVIEELVKSHILSAANEQVDTLVSTYRGFHDLDMPKAAASVKLEVEHLYAIIDELKENCRQMADARGKALAKKDMATTAQAYAQKIRPYFETIRSYADQLEKIVDDTFWKLPKYRELLFLR